MNKWIAAGIAILGPAAGLLVWVGGIAGDQADTKRRLTTVEDRQKEDRRNTRETIGEVKEHVKQIDSNVQIILQTVKSMEAVQKSESRRSR